MDSFEELKGNDTAKWVLAASCIKQIGEFTIALFQPLFFGNVYPDYGFEFNIASAFTYLVPTTIGAIIGGVISDKLEDRSYMSKAWIVIISNFISSPFAFQAFMSQDNFWYSVGAVNFQWFLSEAWFAPTLVMLQNTTSP